MTEPSVSSDPDSAIRGWSMVVIAGAGALAIPTFFIWPILGMAGPMHGPMGKFTLYTMFFGPGLLVAAIIVGVVAYRTNRLRYLIGAGALLTAVAAAWILFLQN